MSLFIGVDIGTWSSNVLVNRSGGPSAIGTARGGSAGPTQKRAITTTSCTSSTGPSTQQPAISATPWLGVSPSSRPVRSNQPRTTLTPQGTRQHNERLSRAHHPRDEIG